MSLARLAIVAVIGLLAQQVRVGPIRVPIPPAPGEVQVSTAPQLTAALARGGTIRLSPGRYVGNFIIDQSNTTLRGFTLPTTRVTLGATAGIILQPSDTSRPSLEVRGPVSHVLVDGISFGPLPDRATIVLGSTATADPLQQPDDVTFDRIECHAATAGGVRCMEVHTRAFTVQRSLIDGWFYQGRDSQAVLVYNGPGPHRVIDNRLSASGENILFGGASDRSANMIATNAVVRGNLVDKPEEWRGKTGSVKNSIEFKSVRGALVERNIIDGCWTDGQTGNAFVLTPRDQNNDNPWTVVQDVIIRENIITPRHRNGYAVNILLHDSPNPSQDSARVTIERNLFHSPRGILVVGGLRDYLRVTDNTMPDITSNLMTFDGKVATYVKPVLTFQRNVVKAGPYAIGGPETAIGKPTLDGYTAAGSVFTSNIIEKDATSSPSWPTGNTVLTAGTLASKLDALFHYIPGGAGY